MSSTVAYLVGVRGAHEYDGAFFGHLPAAPGVHFPEEELHQERKGRQKTVIDEFVHDGNGLFVLGHDGGRASRAALLVGV